MEKNEEPIEIKQTYLREVILEAGYDAEQFVAHLQSVKPDGGADLENWTMDELAHEVTKFKEFYAQDGSPTKPKEEDTVEETKGENLTPSKIASEPTTSVLVNPEDEDISTLPAPVPIQAPIEEKAQEPEAKDKKVPETVPQEEVKKPESPVQVKGEDGAKKPAAGVAEPLAAKILPTKKINEVPAPDLKAIITEVKMVNPGFFSYKYEVYVISTPSKGFLVERRQSAFDDLRAILVKLHPGYMAPVLPKGPIKRLETELMEKRRQKLQIFLDELLRHPVLRCSKLLMKFLSEKNEKAYEAYKKKFEKVPCPKEVAHCYTMEGSANVAYDSHLEHDCGEVRSAIDNIKSIFTELKPLNTALSSDLLRLAETTGKISAAYNRVAGLYGAAVGGAGMFDIFTTLGEVFNSLSITCKKLEGSYIENFDNYFRRQKRELTAVQEVVCKWQEAWIQYTKFQKRLGEKKDMMFEQKQVDKWELPENCPFPVEVLLKNKEAATSQMLPKETADLAKCQEVYGYFCNKVCEEFRWDCHKIQGDTCEHLIGVANMQNGTFEKVCKMWKDLAKHLEELRNVKAQDAVA